VWYFPGRGSALFHRKSEHHDLPRHTAGKPKSARVAYILLWTLGLLGAHRYYLRKPALWITIVFVLVVVDAMWLDMLSYQMTAYVTLTGIAGVPGSTPSDAGGLASGLLVLLLLFSLVIVISWLRDLFRIRKWVHENNLALSDQQVG
jgi:hypothetical protein